MSQGEHAQKVSSKSVTRREQRFSMVTENWYFKNVHKAVTGDVFGGVFLCCPFSPRDIMDEIWDLIESVSESFPSYSSDHNV